MVRYPARPTTVRERQFFIRTSLDALPALAHDDPVACLAEQVDDGLQQRSWFSRLFGSILEINLPFGKNQG